MLMYDSYDCIVERIMYYADVCAVRACLCFVTVVSCGRSVGVHCDRNKSLGNWIGVNVSGLGL